MRGIRRVHNEKYAPHKGQEQLSPPPHHPHTPHIQKDVDSKWSFCIAKVDNIARAMYIRLVWVCSPKLPTFDKG